MKYQNSLQQIFVFPEFHTPPTHVFICNFEIFHHYPALYSDSFFTILTAESGSYFFCIYSASFFWFIVEMISNFVNPVPLFTCLGWNVRFWETGENIFILPWNKKREMMIRIDTIRIWIDLTLEFWMQPIKRNSSLEQILFDSHFIFISVLPRFDIGLYIWCNSPVRFEYLNLIFFSFRIHQMEWKKNFNVIFLPNFKHRKM